MITTMIYIVALVIGIQHFYIMYLEMYKFKSEKAQKIFNTPKELQDNEYVDVLFKNQGLYNGFLGAGILFSLILSNLIYIYFFFICVLVAALYGSKTANKKILLVQGLLPFIGSILISIDILCK